MNMNIAFSKIGKSIKFNDKNYSPIGGDNEAPTLLRVLARLNPDIKFYLVGRSDFDRLTERQRVEMFPNNNVVDLYDVKIDGNHTTFVGERLKSLGVTIDAHIAMCGQVGNVTIPNRIWGVRDPSRHVNIIDMTRGYSTPVTAWMNDNLDMPTIQIVNDPRYTFAQAKDLMVSPKVTLSQYDTTFNHSRIRSYEDQTRIDVPFDLKYAGMEKIFLCDRKEPVINLERPTNFMIAINEGSPSRYPMLKEWVLDHVQDVEVYGQWSEDVSSADTRFKGSLHIEELQRKMNGVRCTFIIPIAPGWVTSKYVEMIYAGVVPFFHPSYDSKCLLGDLEFLRVETPKQLMDRVSMMHQDDLYERTIKYLQKKFIKQSDLDGIAINDNIMKSIDPSYVRHQVAVPTKIDVGLDSFFE